MADDKRLDQVTAAGAIQATDILPVAQTGSTALRRATAQQVADFASASGVHVPAGANTVTRPAQAKRRSMPSSGDYQGAYPLNWSRAHAQMVNEAQFVKYLWAGVFSHDENNNYNPDMGGLFLGGFYEGQPIGVRIIQEGRRDQNESGSWAVYPLEPNRWCGLSIAPSGDPWDLPGENVTSVACQLVNGANEERLTITAKWFGDETTGSGEYRFAPFKLGTGRLWPMTFANGEARLLRLETSKFINLTNENFDGSSGGNTLMRVVNPSHTSRIDIFARQDGTRGFENFNAGSFVSGLLADSIGWTLSGAQPTLSFNETDASANARRWFFDAAGSVFRGFAVNDAVNSFGQWLAVYRSGSTVTGVEFPVQTGFFAALPAHANDAAAAAGGVPVRYLYWNTTVGAVAQRRV